VKPAAALRLAHNPYFQMSSEALISFGLRHGFAPPGAPIRRRIITTSPMVMKRWTDAMRPSVDDYHALLAKVASVLRKDTCDARQELYDRARMALRAEFGKLEPLPSDAELSEEQRKLDVAIFEFEFSAPLGVN
jgi:hypothetical protein